MSSGVNLMVTIIGDLIGQLIHSFNKELVKVTIGNTTIDYLVPALLAQLRQDIGKLLRLHAPFRFIKGSVDLEILQGTYRVN
jgi:hypothetical protein